MRRLTTAVPAVLATVVAVLTLSTGTALAHGSEHPAGAKVAHAQESEHHHGNKRAKKARPVVEVTGVVSDTPTATIGSASDTATSTITLTVKRGERSLRGMTVVLTVDRLTVVRRGGRAASASDVVKGDHVSAKLRRMPDGSWLALRLNASGRHEDAADD